MPTSAHGTSSARRKNRVPPPRWPRAGTELPTPARYSLDWRIGMASEPRYGAYGFGNVFRFALVQGHPAKNKNDNGVRNDANNNDEQDHKQLLAPPPYSALVVYPLSQLFPVLSGFVLVRGTKTNRSPLGPCCCNAGSRSGFPDAPFRHKAWPCYYGWPRSQGPNAPRRKKARRGQPSGPGPCVRKL